MVDKNPFGCALLHLKKGPNSIPSLFPTRVIFQSVKRLAPNGQGSYKSCKSSVACFFKVLHGACNLFNFKLLGTGSSSCAKLEGNSCTKICIMRKDVQPTEFNTHIL